MTLDDFLEEFRRQRVWSKRGQRSPHKALALLYALGQLRQGRPAVPYAIGAPAIRALLQRFGRPRDQHRPAQPIWRLRPRNASHRAIWKVTLADGATLPETGNPPEALLTQHGIFSLSDDAIALFTSHPDALDAAADAIAESVVPDTLRDELLDATVGEVDLREIDDAPEDGSSDPVTVLHTHRRVRTYRLQRDPRFARAVLEAYGYRCAVCRASPRLGDDHFGLEAAHIRWVQANGPNVVQNGLSLCRMHHVALDRGAFMIDRDRMVRVSPLVDSSDASRQLFWQHDSRPIEMPSAARHAPAPEHCAWHRDEVFRDGTLAG
jgi:putative restriction endonuclease